MKASNIFEQLPRDLEHEVFDQIVDSEHVAIERTFPQHAHPALELLAFGHEHLASEADDEAARWRPTPTSQVISLPRRGWER